MKRSYIALLLIAVALVSSCNGKDDPSKTNPDNSKYEFLSKDAPSALTKAELENVAKVNDFAFDFAAGIDKSEQNKSYVCSPVSMAYLLGMLSNGAVGTTRSEICSALGFGEEGQQELNEFCRDLMVVSAPAGNSDEVLELANTAVINKDFSLLESYKKSAKNYYDADICSKDFASENIAKYVNDWASDKTHGRIKKLLEQVPPTMQAIFINALYFKASWVDSFDKRSTKDETFVAESGVKRTEKMMYKREYIPYAAGSNFSMVNLSFGHKKDSWIEAGNYNMAVLLPNPGVSIQDVLNGLDGAAWSNAMAASSSSLVDLKLPRFEAEMDLNMNSVLKSLGINRIFGDADFSAMTEKSVFVDQIKQVANISVDENGAEAAAASVAILAGSAGPGSETPKIIEFHCDRPFIFAITEQTTGAILFLGSYK